MSAIYILRAVDDNGNVSFYTGRAGDRWLSPDRSDAFAGYNAEGARRKATQFNLLMGLHGQRFVAVPAEPTNDQ